MLDTNPYAAPETRPAIRSRRHWSSLVIMGLRALAVIWGFNLLAGPSRPAPNHGAHEGQVAVKSFGAILLLVAFFPFGEGRGRSRSRETGPEEL